MRVAIVLTMAVIRATGLTACGKSNAPSAATPDALPSAPLLSNVSAARDFVARAVAGDQFEVDAGNWPCHDRPTRT